MSKAEIDSKRGRVLQEQLSGSKVLVGSGRGDFRRESQDSDRGPAFLPHQDQGRGFFDDFTDILGGDVALAEGDNQLGRVFGAHREEQAAGGLRIKEQALDFLRDAIRELDAAGDKLDVPLEPSGDEPLARAVKGLRQKLDPAMVEYQAGFAARGHLARVAEQAETGDVRS